MTIARAAEAEVRLVCLRPLPPPRVDGFDHVVADTDQEMSRITSSTRQTFDAATRRFEDVTVETVVRFGAPAREAVLEAEAYAPQIIVVFAAAGGLLSRLRAWALRRRLTGRTDARLLVLQPARVRQPGRAAGDLTRPELLPARRD